MKARDIARMTKSPVKKKSADQHINDELKKTLGYFKNTKESNISCL
jgi:hypothetical protein